MGRDSSVGIATRYRLDGSGIESRWGQDIAHPASYTMGTKSFPGVNRPGHDVDHPPSSSAEVKERIELYLYSPSGPSWPVTEWTLPLPLPLFVLWDLPDMRIAASLSSACWLCNLSITECYVILMKCHYQSETRCTNCPLRHSIKQTASVTTTAIQSEMFTSLFVKNKRINDRSKGEEEKVERFFYLNSTSQEHSEFCVSVTNFTTWNFFECKCRNYIHLRLAAAPQTGHLLCIVFKWWICSAMLMQKVGVLRCHCGDQTKEDEIDENVGCLGIRNCSGENITCEV
jgi:hypothetical protein